MLKWINDYIKIVKTDPKIFVSISDNVRQIKELSSRIYFTKLTR